jgi:tetratricopeptide (TPR) repeat protein
MNKNGKIKKMVLLVFSGSLLLFCLTGCSSLKNLYGWVPFSGYGENPNNFTKKEMKRFIAGIRPYRGNADSHYRLACYFQKRKKHEKAVEEFLKVVLIDPDHVKAYNGIGVSCDLLGDYSRAVRFYEAALKLNPDLAYVHNNLGYSHLLQGKIDSAIDAFSKAVALDDKSRRYHNNLGLAYAKKGQSDQALAEFEQAGDEAKAHYNLAQIFYQKGLNQQAKNHFVKALAINPSLGKTKNSLKLPESVTPMRQPENRKTDKEPVEVEISNGNGVRRMAKRVGNYLRKKGFKNKTCLNDADHFNHAKTKIYYCSGYLHNAYRIAKEIPGYQDMEKVINLGQPNTKIRVLIGRDMIPFNKRFTAG